MSSETAQIKRFSISGLFATLACTITLALALIGVIFYGDPHQFPGVTISLMLLFGGLGAIFGWSYLIFNRPLLGWTLSASLSVCAVAIAILAVLEHRAADITSIGNDARIFAEIASINAVITVALIRSLLRRSRSRAIKFPSSLQ